ncbi:MAG TPA: NAD(P)-dependent oxidoreductase [Fuerstia sp.]|nr:NAD(P)-dependent oxidoreductase [Fuerstiella sp.]
MRRALNWETPDSKDPDRGRRERSMVNPRLLCCSEPSCRERPSGKTIKPVQSNEHTTTMRPTPRSTAELDRLISEPSQEVMRAVEQCPGTFAVLGAGGKMGFHASLMLQRALRKLGRNDAVMTVSRFSSPATRQQFDDAGFRVIAADLSDPQSVADLPLAENILFLAGVKFGTSNQPDMLQRMNVDMPKLVAEHYRTARIVALSTGCVYSFTTPESGGATEDSEVDPPGDYARSCRGREAAFEAAADTCGTRSSLIRLNYSIDLRYGVLVDIAQKVRACQPVNVEMGYANVIWQGDAIAQTIQSLPHASAPPFVVNITGPNVLRIRVIANMFADRFGCQPIIEGDEQATAWLSSAAKAQAMFGEPGVSLTQMVHWIADWLEQGGETLGKPTHFEVRSGSY